MVQKRQGTERLPFGRILKQLMQERGLTIRAVAEMAGVSPSVAQSWLNKASPHDLQAVGRLAKALNVSFKALLLGEAETETKQVGISDLFEEQELLDGLCQVTIKRLVPKREKK